VAQHDHLRELPITERYPDEVWRAANYAATAHENQKRKLSGNHFIEHPFGVLELVRGVTDDVPTLQAAILHDTVEDTGVTFEDLEREFGRQARLIVWGVTKDDTVEDKDEQKLAYLSRLRFEAPEASVIVALGDKIHNITDQIENHQILGDEMWNHFSSRAEGQVKWFRATLEVGKERVPGCPLVEKLEAQIEAFCVRVLGAAASRRLVG
jgi:(p)ppGpp synthase/HD superfamily hydrolase